MKWIDVSSAKAEIVKKTAALKNAQTARREGLFLVEGLRSVEELLTARGTKAGGFEPEYLLAEQTLLDRDLGYRDRLEQALGADTRVYRLSKEAFLRVSDTETPQGILAVVRRRADSVEQVLANGRTPLILVLENLQDPGNAGTILRTADAAGANGVIALRGTVDYYSAKVVRSSMGSLLHLPVAQGAELCETVAALKAAGVRVYAAALGGMKPHFEAALSGPCAFLIGNEGNGLSAEAVALADEILTIPMPGSAESLNAAMAAGILTYEAVRQRMMK